MRTKSVLLTFLAILFTNLHAAAQDPIKQGHNGKRVLVVYFSATGTTAETAKKLARVTGGELCAITPAKPYTNADLDWHNKQSRNSVEMSDLKLCPVLKNKKENIADYEVIFIGYPIWWNFTPRVMNTSTESHDLRNKAIVPFAILGGGSIIGSVTVLKKDYHNLKWKERRLLNRANEKSIHEWVDKLGY